MNVIHKVYHTFLRKNPMEHLTTIKGIIICYNKCNK